MPSSVTRRSWVGRRSLVTWATNTANIWCDGSVKRKLAGSADLCAYFFLRARQILRENGGFGMLATNTIAQGDTRRAYAYFKESIKAVDTRKGVSYVEEAAVVTPRRRCHV